ncbi:unnamed protein product [Brassicogethes aeneus]|uniref:Iporin n=1 Tax=Brassicogethes aeneus TaxID=1431903 RepID=A0A9P0BBQ8_BRAAE|nr:unnamed protein product [Brassicogethes aeneus]
MIVLLRRNRDAPYQHRAVPDNFRYRSGRYAKGRGMSELGVGIRASPDSDCNSNHPGSASYLSNTSSQDIDFIQDNSDYQWFIDYGYRDGGINHHTSILSLPESYEAGDLNYYDAIAKNMDANLAEADMESFRTEDIHALLTNLPPMCTDHLSQENHRQGECYASVSGSMMGKFDLDSSISPHSSSQGEDSTSMSICKSELLFSPVKETPMPGANFSVDSLDCDMMLTCQANKDNYTIAFEGSMTMFSEENDFNAADKTNHHTASSHWPTDCLRISQAKNLKNLDASMTKSDSSSFTTWSNLKKRSSDNHLRRLPSGNNNNSGDDASRLGLNDMGTLKSQSMPNLYKQRIMRSMVQSGHVKSNSNNSSTDTCTVKRKPVKVFDIQHHLSSENSSLSEMATSVDATTSENSSTKPHNFNLVKLFMKQKSISTEGMSTTLDQLSSTENWPASQSGESSASEKALEKYDLIEEEPENEEILLKNASKMNINNVNGYSSPLKLHRATQELMNRSIQTSHFSEIANLKKNAAPKSEIKVIEASFLKKLKKEGEVEKPVYVLYPNYVLPNLDFLNEKRGEDISKVLLVPQRAPKLSTSNKRPFSCNDLEALKRRGFNHVKDWDSLNILLPQECKKILSEVPEISEHIKVTHKDPSFVRQKYRQRPQSCDLSSTSSSNSTQPSSGYRGSSTILSDSQSSPATTNLNPLFVYRYDSVTSSEASLMTSDRITMATPPIPVRCVSLPQGEKTPPRPPLPRSILRKGDVTKRYSMYETSEEENNVEDATYKRKSLQEPYYLRNKRFSETEDEGVDAGTSSSSIEENNHDNPHRADLLLSNISNEELAQFEEFLKISGISGSEHESHTEESLMQLRSYVGKFLSLKINQEGSDHFGGKKSVSFAEKVNVLPKHLEARQFVPPNNSPNVSAFLHQKNYHTKNLTDMPICEESENSPNYSSPQTTPVHLIKISNLNGNLTQKKSLISAVCDAVDQIMQHFSPASNQQELNALGDSSANPSCAKLALTTLCPALYAVLSDGLKPSLETSFGAIGNSVWQVVEASAQQGPLTKALNELVMRINGEDVITEGLVKFNAFVFGLLNVRSLDAWASYLRTRESVLRKHYTGDSLLLLSNTGGPNVRSILDAMIAALRPLAFLPFQLDLLFEYRELHMSFKRMDSYHQLMSPTHKHSCSPNFKQFNSAKLGLSSNSTKSNSDTDEISTATTVRNYYEEMPDLVSSSQKVKKERPRSCVESGQQISFKLGEDVTSIGIDKKRWSGIALNSKLYQAYDRLANEEEYTDSLETPNSPKKDEKTFANVLEHEQQPESLDSNFSDEKPLNGRRFKKLQQKWEMLSGKESPPLSPTSTPSKSRIPRLIPSPVKSGIPILKKVTTPPGSSKNAPLTRITAVKSSPAKKTGQRTSRVDQLDNPVDTPRNVSRPSSLPYKATPQNGKSPKITPPRRAASSSLNRKPVGRTATPKVVRTLSHRLPSESGHLSYNKGENLKVVLEVDEKWLLCCRGTQKGLVPKSAVIAENARF